ncbi:MAG TPA: alpha/beta hydrolase [Kofleriaceae bacterium]|nr:alpha/beta hydrolase [Kofleriaceae bacterium]
MSSHIQAAAQARPVRTTGATRSADGTQIGWEQVGEGVAIVVVHGGTRAAEHYRALADALAARFTVIAYDRRGRGASGPARVDDGLDVEIADLEAVLRATGATRVFGHSAGAVVSIEAALRLPMIQRLALYEPPLGPSVPTAWLPGFEQALADDHVARAMALAIDGLQMGPRYVPVWALALPIRLLARGEAGRKLATLLRTLPRDLATARSVPPGFDRYRQVACPTLLLRGGKSPRYLHEALDALAAVLPRVEAAELPDAGHNAPDNEAPQVVAAHLTKIFAE